MQNTQQTPDSESNLPNTWEECPICQCPDAYVIKDVPKNLFLGSLILFLGFALYLFSIEWWWGMSALLGITAVDYLLYQILPDAVVCYGCKKVFRKLSSTFVKDSGLKAFDPHMGERYRH